MQFRAIATDLDGTLLRDDKSVSARTRAAVDAAEDAGLLFVIATGRPPRWIPPVIEQLGERGLVVCANGGSVFDPARHELVARNDLDPTVVADLVDDVSGAFPDALFGVEQGFRFAVDELVLQRPEDQARMDSWKDADLRIVPIRSVLDEGVTKLIIRLPHPAPDGTADAVQAVVGRRAKVTHSVDESFLELSRPDITKAATVEQLLLESGIAPHEVVAFGDMPNDLALIEWAGLGVAVANAHPALREAADEVTVSNDDDGVAVVIERILSEL
ncbi:MAG TPA: HAD family hydrolase [Acidimicrobiales bacterium]|nr:HAD family hydrolase [Acidimicrobiales bacterium]